MKTLKESILESLFTKKDFPKHNYMIDVINALCNNDSIRIGDKGQNTFTIDASIQQSIKNDFDALGRNISYEDFNNICKKYGLPEWSKIFKGDFSGYTNGLASKNKGNAFEIDFVDNFKFYADDFANCVGVDVNDLHNATLDLVGGNNNSRPLTITNKNITVGDIKTSGDMLADVVINTLDNKYNASLKCGSSVTFINCGVGKIFTRQEFNKYKQTGIYEPTEEGRQLLDFFGIDHTNFADIFVNYKGTNKSKKSRKVTINVTQQAKTKQFYEFLKSVIGYNYILVHKGNNNKVHYYNLLTEKQLNDFIGKIQSMHILYPIDGDAKRIDILLETSKLSIKFNIRSKDGGIEPTHLMSDYTIK
jgi:hypothetical protein